MQDTSVYWGTLQFLNLLLCCHWRKPMSLHGEGHRDFTSPCHYLAWPCIPACGLCPAAWGAGPGARPTAGGTASSARAAGTASRPTASSSTAPGCTCRHPCLSTCWAESSVRTVHQKQLPGWASSSSTERQGALTLLWTHLGTRITPGSHQHDTLQPPFPLFFLSFNLFWSGKLLNWEIFRCVMSDTTKPNN